MKSMLVTILIGVVSVGATEWPQWRGPNGNGSCALAQPPLRWDEQTNLRWKTALPGRGHSSPVVWGETIYLTAAVPTDQPADAQVLKDTEEGIGSWMRASARRGQTVHQFVVLAVDRRTGQVRWRRTVCEEAPHTATHTDGSWASGSCITDGERVYAFFGSQGLYCLDNKGRVLWQKRFGYMKTRASFGEGSSPALHGQTLVVNWDQEGPSFILALDKRTGEQRWKVDRDEATSWSTPLITEYGGQAQVIVSATKRIRSYALADGKLLWECGGMTGNVIPTPVRFADTVVALSGFRGAAGLAIKLDQAQGDITDKAEALAWKLAKDTPYTPSPVLVGRRLYFLKVNDPQLSCLDVASGQWLYANQNLAGSKRFYASPVAAAGRVYLASTEGLTHVLQDGATFEVLATNRLEDKFTASPALAGRDLILRGERFLYCLSEAK